MAGEAAPARAGGSGQGRCSEGEAFEGDLEERAGGGQTRGEERSWGAEGTWRHDTKGKGKSRAKLSAVAGAPEGHSGDQAVKEGSGPS